MTYDWFRQLFETFDNHIDDAAKKMSNKVTKMNTRNNRPYDFVRIRPHKVVAEEDTSVQEEEIIVEEEIITHEEAINVISFIQNLRKQNEDDLNAENAVSNKIREIEKESNEKIEKFTPFLDQRLHFFSSGKQAIK